MPPIHRKLRLIGIALIAALGVAACDNQPAAPQSISQSHIDANIPAESDFDGFLKRDLEAYFSTTYGKPVTVSYQLLRSAPTQSGLSFPSFYAWIKVVNAGKELDQGAIEVDALYRKYFEVTYYASRRDIFQNPDALDQHFPPQVANLIRRTYAPCAPPAFC
jgi:hypothetical protein